MTPTQKCIYLDPKRPQSLAPSAMAIGNFDGVHLGHQNMIAALLRLAKEHGCQSAALLFEPQPKELFLGDKAPPRLLSLREKSDRLLAMGVDRAIVARFDRDFASLSAGDFCQLLRQMGVIGVVVGKDFRFGANRAGDLAFLQQEGFFARAIDDIKFSGERISSTRVRTALATGDLDTAAALLGEPYRVSGRVVHGDKLGRAIGFPTANIALQRPRLALRDGVFAVDAVFDATKKTTGGLLGLRPNSLFGCASVGVRPSVEGNAFRLEVFFPRFNGNLYGKTLDIAFYRFLRPQARYADLDALKKAIAHDVDALMAWRQSLGNPVA